MEIPTSPQNRIPDQEQRVSILLTLELSPDFDTSQWPAHMIIDDGVYSAGIRGGLNELIAMGIITPGEPSHVMALIFDDQDRPDWLPKATLAGPSCSREIMPILEHSWKGDNQDGVQLSPLGDERPKPRLEANTGRISLRGVPGGDRRIRECHVEEVEGHGFRGRGTFVAPEKVPALVLDSISVSHFVEKVRWNLDRAGIDYVENASGGTLGAFFAGRTVPRLRIRTGAVRSQIGNSPEILRYLWGAISGRDEHDVSHRRRPAAPGSSMPCGNILARPTVSRPIDSGARLGRRPIPPKRNKL